MASHSSDKSCFRRDIGQCRAIVSVFALLLTAGEAQAQIFVDYTWNNSIGGSYHSAANWTPSSGFGGIPDSDNEGAVFNLAGQYGVALSSNISTNSAIVRDGTVLLALGTAANPRSYTLNSLTVDPAAGGGDPHLAIFDGTLNATTIRVAGGGQFDLDSDALNFDDGSVTVAGEGSRLSQHTGFLRVGESGTGTLLVEDGGTVENADGAAIGRFAGSDGAATVTGAGSMLDVDANLTIGQEGMGTLLVEDGGTVENVLGRVAFNTDAVGTVTVTGEGSTWTNSGELRVGESGDGTLTVVAGGTVTNLNGFIGFNDGSTGSVNVRGSESTWTNMGLLSIGDFGEGNLMISDGGNVSSQGGRLGSGSEFFSGNGMATVTGAGSTWISNGNLNVGSMEDGTLTIEAGGSVSNTMGVIGDFGSSNGTVTVSGAGSTWTNNDILDIGSSGTGELVISDGGSVNNTLARIGREADSEGTVIVTGGGSTWTNNSELRVGNMGEGRLTISDGGSVSNTIGLVGQQTDSIGSVFVVGVGSTWTNQGALVIGESGTGFLTISNGGGVSSTHAFMGRLPGSFANATVLGDGSLWSIDGLLSIGGSAGISANGGSGSLDIFTGGTVDVALDVILFPDGLLRLLGGTLTTTAIRFEGGGDFQLNAGTLHVGVYNGDLVNSGGTLAPGQSAGGTTIVGDYTQQSGATLEIEIGGTATATQYDFVDVNGDALLGGSLELSLINDFLPSPDGQFIVFNADDLSGFFTNAGNGQRLDTTDALGSFLVHYGPTSMFTDRQNQIVLTDFEPAPELPGDYNDDGVVNAADYVAWRNNVGAPAGTLPNDPIGGEIDQAQYATWAANFGATSDVGPAGSAVPEPSTLLLAITALASSVFGRCRARLDPDHPGK